MVKHILRTAILALVFPASLANADLLVWNDSGTHRHYFGNVVKHSEQGVLFRSRGPATTENVWFPRNEIVTLVVNINDVRLSRLSIDNLNAYRNYAEELAEQRADGQARDLAIRLFLIVAYWADQEPKTQGYPELRDSSIRNLIPLARTEVEHRAFQKLAFLHDLKVIQTAETSAGNRLVVDEEMKQQLLGLVKAVRTSDRERAIELTSRDAIKKSWSRWSGLCNWDDLGRVIKSDGPSAIQLERLLQIEAELLTNQAALHPTNRLQSWAVQSADYDARTELLPTFSNVTEFDPRQAVFQNGQWMEPLTKPE